MDGALAIPGALVFVGLVLPAPAGAFEDVVVSAGGKISHVNGRTLEIGHSSQRDVKRAEGKPDGVYGVMGRGGEVGTELEYEFKTKFGTCTRSYQFPKGKGSRLQDFDSNCLRLRTRRGTKVGMAPEKAEEREGSEAAYSGDGLGHDCQIDGYAISREHAGNWLVLWMAEESIFDTAPPPYGHVVSIGLHGPNGVYWRSHCA